MQRLSKLSNKFQKRTLRALYGQTQAYPYAASLDSSFRAADGTLQLPIVAGSTLPTRTSAAFTLKNGLVPGTVVTAVPDGETVRIAVGNAAYQGAGGINGTGTSEQPFGLLANFVGGELDEIGDDDFVGVWRGPSSVFELLAPAFGTVAITATNAGGPTPLYAGADGRLTTTAGGTAPVVVANLLDVIGSTRIIVELKV